MGLSDYTSPFFGTIDMGNYAPPAYTAPPNMTARNRPSTRVLNDKGQVIGGDIYMQATYHHFTSAYSIQKENRHWQGTVTGMKEDRPSCILAVPATYGNKQYTAEGQEDQLWGGCVRVFNEMPTFYYFLVGMTNNGRWSMRYDNKDGFGNTVAGFIRLQGAIIPEIHRNPPYGSLPIITDSGTFQDMADRTAQDLASDGLIANLPDRLTQYNSNTPDGVRWYGYNQEIVTFPEGMIASLRTALSHWKEVPNSVINKVYFNTISNRLYSPVQANRIGAYIATGFPVFTVSNMEEMVKYFQDGNWKADNDDELPPPKDWSTDWKIYVKGAQRPDIWVTMSSAKVDEWLSNMSENVSGATKEDIKVEYRYREHKMDIPISPAEPPSYSEEYEVKRWGTTPYNETRATSYSENILLNYPALTSALDFGEFSDATIDGLFPYYAELGFRLKYGKYKSTWCRYEIGVIGSPSVPDFAEMHNIGTQDDGWQDESTVELIYDQIPEGEEPYPDEPEPDMPKPKPTDPTPSDPTISGLGLLTTTYKITNANAQALGRFFWGGDLFEKIKALNMSPIENVVGLVMMPINVAGTSSVITIGNVDTNINGDVIKSVPLYELGSIELKGRYGSFLDYEPYTSAFIFLPFVGFVRLDPAYFTNKTLKVVYAYDIICGLCKAMLFADGIYVESHQGQCGIEIPLIASNRSQLQLSLASSLMESTASAATGNFAAAAGQLGSGIANYVSGFHTNRQGNYSPTTAWNETRECFIVIESVNASRSPSFAHDYGLPCAATYNIGQLSGFTQCAETVDVRGISGATEEEKAEIYTLLTGGFFV